ncbi:MAG: ABC transporter substrate-binding protein [Burkholderiales bacterium]|nr:ABC transporter substrate-binding protein [Burkholderiales bacterium]
MSQPPHPQSSLASAACAAPTSPARRRWLKAGAGLAAAGLAGPAVHAQTRTAARDLSVVQITDMSPAQQDISRDFVAGARAAWQQFNANGGLQGRIVQHQVIEVDGSADALARVWNDVRREPQHIALTGTTGHATASALGRLVQAGVREGSPPVAHVAPWLHDTPAGDDALTFPIFAPREEQIGHALRTLSIVGVPEIGVIYATPEDRRQSHGSVQRAADDMKLTLRVVPPGNPSGAPAIVLFVGGTPELVRLCQLLARAGSVRQQFVVALADANLQTLALSGAPANVPVIGTQPVPVVTASMPVVRQFRDALARLFDEAPTPHSLAGYLAARYTQQVMRGMDGTPSRQSVLAAFARRPAVELGGFRINAGASGLGSTYVTQSMLTRDGRLVG